MCSKPVRVLEDMKGLRVRAAGHTVPLATALGASVVNVPSSEIYEVMERGQVDCVFGPPNWLEASSLGEIAKYNVNVNAGTVPNPSTLMLRADLWSGLSAEEQALILAHAPQAVAGAYYGTLETDVNALAADGIEEIEPDAALAAAMADAASGALETAIAKAEEGDVANARAIAEKFLAAYERWKGLTANVDSEAAYAQLLADEVFSKFKPAE